MDTLANTKFNFFDFNLNVSKLTFKNNGDVACGSPHGQERSGG